MEKVLWLYAQPYDSRYPVICFDERPCFLIGDTIMPLPMTNGKPLRENYTYAKLGSCALLAAIEPLTGCRLAQVHAQRTKKEYTLFCQALDKAWPEAHKIRLVQDNLNTHNASSFYQHLPAQEAFALAQRFEFFYTPKSASWLNMIEIELSAIARMCLNRRIATREQLTTEVLTLVQHRHDHRIKINWQFSISDRAAKTFIALQRVNPANTICDET